MTFLTEHVRAGDVELTTTNAHRLVVTRVEGNMSAVGNGRGQHISAVVIGMFTQKVYATRRASRHLRLHAESVSQTFARARGTGRWASACHLNLVLLAARSSAANSRRSADVVGAARKP